MEILNVGPLEVIIIILLMFVLLGPKDMIITARKMGLAIRRFVRSPIWREIMGYSQEIRELPQKLMEETGLEETLEDVRKTTEEAASEINASLKETAEAANEVKTTLKETVEAARVPEAEHVKLETVAQAGEPAGSKSDAAAEVKVEEQTIAPPEIAAEAVLAADAVETQESGAVEASEAAVAEVLPKEQPAAEGLPEETAAVVPVSLDAETGPEAQTQTEPETPAVVQVAEPAAANAAAAAAAAAVAEVLPKAAEEQPAAEKQPEESPEEKPAPKPRKPRTTRKKAEAESAVAGAVMPIEGEEEPAPKPRKPRATRKKAAAEEQSAVENLPAAEKLPVENEQAETQIEPPVKPRRRKTKAAEVPGEAAGSVVEVQPVETQPAVEILPEDKPAPKPRKPRTRKKAAEVAAAEEQPAAEGQPAVEATTGGAVVFGDSGESPEEKPAPKPRKSRTTRKKAEAAEEQPENLPKESPAEKPARKPRTRKKAVETAENLPEVLPAARSKDGSQDGGKPASPDGAGVEEPAAPVKRRPGRPRKVKVEAAVEPKAEQPEAAHEAGQPDQPKSGNGSGVEMGGVQIFPHQERETEEQRSDERMNNNAD